MSDLRVLLLPFYRGPDKADGGIRRVVEAQLRWLPEFGVRLVDTISAADVVASHAVEHPDVPVGQPWVTHCHGLYWQDMPWQGEWYQKANRKLVDILRAADHVTAPSEWVAQVLRRHMWLDPTVLYHGVDPAEWEGGANEGYVWWDKARADAASDPRPVGDLARLAPDLRFVTTFGASLPNTRVTGALPYPEAAELTKNAGAYLATTRETFGISILQAMAAGVPVVGWRWGGAAEIIRHGETGWLATPGDVDGLLEGIRWAIANRARVGDAARTDVLARWTWEQAVRRYVDVYQNLARFSQERRARPRVAVVIPCYNLGKYVTETIRSVQAQTERDFECVIVDDASTDNSAAVIAEAIAGDARFRYLRNEKNEHVAVTRNRGIAATTAPYVICIDADDRMTPDTLRTLDDALDADRGIHLAYGGLQVMHENGTLREGANGWPVPFEFKEQIVGRNQVPTLCMFRREVWERTGGYRRRVQPVEDADLWTRAASLGFVPKMVTDAPLLQYRVRANSISRTMPNPQWVDWYPWSRQRALTPFAAPVDPPARQQALPVPTFEPAKVAVIIPVGPGHESLLWDALDSVEAQSYRQWECCVINNTGAALSGLPPWVRRLELPREGPSGPAAARNAGIAATAAPLLLFLDADDYLQPDALETLVRVQAEAGGVVYSQWWDDFGKASKVYDPPEYDARLLTQKGCIHAVTALYPRAAVVAVGGFDEGLSHWEDWDLQLALAREGVCGTKVPRPLWTYRKATGERREANAAAFDEGKAAILAKWGRVWDGKEELMACRSCPGGGGKPLSKLAPMAGGAGGGNQSSAPPEGLVLIESLDPSPSVRTYRGRTGAQYRFGNIPTARVRYVHPEDAAQFLAMPNKFRRVEATADAGGGVPSPRLEAPGAGAPVNILTEAQPAMSDAQAVDAVKAVADGLSYAEVKARMGGWTKEETLAVLEAEHASGRPRSSVIKLLETRVYGAPLSGVPQGAGVS